MTSGETFKVSYFRSRTNFVDEVVVAFDGEDEEVRVSVDLDRRLCLRKTGPTLATSLGLSGRWSRTGDLPLRLNSRRRSVLSSGAARSAARTRAAGPAKPALERVRKVLTESPDGPCPPSGDVRQSSAA